MKQRSAKSKARAAAPATPAPPLSPGRKWLFRITAMLLPVCALAVLELVLRLCGYGYATSFFQEVTAADGSRQLIENPSFSRRFFPPQLTRWPESFKIPAAKPKGVRRIFIFGESAAMGDPQPAYGPGRCLEVLLRERFPNEKFEVVNLGITAINSHVIRDIAIESAGREGDVWLIYMGNNEMVGPFGAATVFGWRAPPSAVVRLYLALQETRVGQLAVSLARKLGRKSTNTSWGGMKMFLQNQISPSDPRRETVYRNFDCNLKAIIRAGQDGGAKVVLSTVSVNLRDCPPFGSMLNSNLASAQTEQFGKVFDEARVAQDGGDFALAVERLAQALKLDAQFAEAHYRCGLCLSALTKAAAAREHLQFACDRDALPFRADTRINDTIKAVAKERGLLLCHAEAELAAAGDNGVAGDESFFEHVHFNFNGNYRLGLAWAKSVADALGLTNAPGDWASQTMCEARLGLTDWNRVFVLEAVVRRMNAPPLSSQSNNAERLSRVRAEAEALRRASAAPDAASRASRLLNAAIARAPEDVYLYEGAANVLEAVGDRRQAIKAYEEILKRWPHSFYANLQMGRLLGELGRPAEGRPLLEQVTRLRPSLVDGWSELAEILIAEGKWAEALKCLQTAEALNPHDSTMVFQQARVLAKLARRGEAIAQYRHGLELSPDTWEARFELAGELAWDNQVDAALREYLELIRLNPRHAVARVNCGVMLARVQRLAEAVQQFEEALRISPTNGAAAKYLAEVQARRNRLP